MRRLCLSMLFIVCLCAQLVAADSDPLDPDYNKEGFSPFREYSSLMPAESIDPFTGNLVIKLTPIELPQRGGRTFSLNLVYNSKIFVNQGRSQLKENSMVGIGWSLSMGRLIAPLSSSPVIEMADGSTHACNTADNGPWKTAEFWTLVKDSSTKFTLTTTDGTKYIYEKQGNNTVKVDNQYPNTDEYFPLTQIVDTYNNQTTITYEVKSTISGDQAAISTISDSRGQIASFQYSDAGNDVWKLDRIDVNGRPFDFIYSYPYEDGHSKKYKLLTKFTAPGGQEWQFNYYAGSIDKFLLHNMSTPNGAKVEYTYGIVSRGGSGVKGVISKTVSGSKMDTESWSYDYSGVVGQHCVTTIDHPGTKSEAHYFDLSSGTWTTGLIRKKEIKDSGVVKQTETYDWHAVAVAGGITKPVISEQIILRDGVSHITTYGGTDSEYSAFSGWDAYGRPRNIREVNGSNVKVTRLTYWDNSNNNLVSSKFVADEIVTVGNDNYANRYSYWDTGKTKTRLLNAKATGTSIISGSGVLTQYSYHSWGDLSLITDANGNHTSLPNYENGMAEKIVNGANYITRDYGWWGELNSESENIVNNVAYTTTVYDYDNLGRLTVIDPPAGDTTNIEYAPLGGWIKKKTGSHELYEMFDSLGRSLGTYDQARQVYTKTEYLSAERKKRDYNPSDVLASPVSDNQKIDLAQEYIGPEVNWNDPVGNPVTAQALSASLIKFTFALPSDTSLGVRLKVVKSNGGASVYEKPHGRNSSVTVGSLGEFEPSTSYTAYVKYYVLQATDVMSPNWHQGDTEETLSGIPAISIDLDRTVRTKTSIYLHWNGTGNDNETYEIEKYNDPVRYTSGTNKYKNFTGLQCGTPYKFRVKAIWGTEEGPWTDWVHVNYISTLDCNSPPVLEISGTTLKWADWGEEYSYEITEYAYYSGATLKSSSVLTQNSGTNPLSLARGQVDQLNQFSYESGYFLYELHSAPSTNSYFTVKASNSSGTVESVKVEVLGQ